jgi:hypothetical protein
LTLFGARSAFSREAMKPLQSLAASTSLSPKIGFLRRWLSCSPVITSSFSTHEDHSTMIHADYVSLLLRALAEPFGVKLTFTDPLDRNRAARKFYKIRDQRRAQNDSSFDVLSIMQRGSNELLIFRRDRVINPPRDDGLLPQNSALAASDLPMQFRRPRGRRQVPAIFQLLRSARSG